MKLMMTIITNDDCHSTKEMTLSDQTCPKSLTVNTLYIEVINKPGT